MAKVFIGATGCKMYLGAAKITKAYLGSQRVYSAGNIVTYKVDSGVTYQEEVDSGASCLAPKTFTPAKSGWTFVGWRTDTTASGSVLTSKVMGDDPVTLYAVFSQTVTLTYYNGSATPTTATKTRYYNNGNVANPTVTLTQAAISGWTARGWSTDAAGNAGVVYANGATVTLTGSLTLYGLYYQTITLALVTDSGTANHSGTRYYNSSGNMVNPTFAPGVPAKSGWTARGWGAATAGNAGVTYASGATFALTGSLTLYALYYQTITLTTVASGATSNTAGTRYYNSSGSVVNPSFTVANPAKTGATFMGWSADGSATVANSSISGLTLDANTTRYAIFKYMDASISIPAKNYENCNMTDALNGSVLYSGINAALYQALTVTVNASAWLDFRGANYTISLACGGGSCVILQPYNDWSVPSVKHGASCNAAITIPFAVASGITDLTVASVCVSPGDGAGYSIGNCYFTSFSDAVLIGRTVVG